MDVLHRHYCGQVRCRKVIDYPGEKLRAGGRGAGRPGIRGVGQRTRAERPQHLSPRPKRGRVPLGAAAPGHQYALLLRTGSEGLDQRGLADARLPEHHRRPPPSARGVPEEGA
jgi:hypothetical protein